MNNLHCGGAEKALISMFEIMDYSLYEVDLYLFKHEGLFMSQIPAEVTLLPEPKEYRYFDMSFKTAVLENLKKARLDIIFNRIAVGIIYKTEKSEQKREQKAWPYLASSLPRVRKKYDVSIGFMEKTPNYFCVDKTNADKKIGYIHNDYDRLGMDAKIDFPYFKKLDKIITVSEECEVVLKARFPEMQEKFTVVANIISSALTRKMAAEKVERLDGEIKFVTVGRLVYQKGYDIAIETAAILKARGIANFKWYILGLGELEESLKNLIAEKGVEEHFVFLGIRENPYPYVKQADIYVQSSRFEGFGIAITEAKILSRPIVLTNFNVAEFQVMHGQNGLISEMDAKSLADQLEILIRDESLRTKFSRNLSQADYGTESEIDKIYKLIEA